MAVLHRRRRPVCGFVPPYLLARLAQDGDASPPARVTLDLDARLRSRREARAPAPAVRDGAATAGPRAGAVADLRWTVHDAGGTTDLPGRAARATGQPPTGDAAVDEAYAGVEASLLLFEEVFGRTSYDGQGAPVIASVHYGTGYDNAFWDGTQLVFGDGDGRVFERFTKPVDVLAHELTHAVTERTAGLRYQGQSGALNESVSDVFAAMLKQRLLGQDAAEADWLIGAGLFRPGINGRALRDMAAPGTAYDDPALGRDPQPDSMAGYVETTDDNGGVHVNSGIPNRAFHLAATSLGGPSWQVAGQVWWRALTSGLAPDADFAGFAAATLAAAEEGFPGAVAAVRQAWTTVGVEPAGSPEGDPPRGSSAAGAGSGAASGTGWPDPPSVVAVRRSGGFAGMVTTGQVVLGDDPRTSEIQGLLVGIDPAAFTGYEPQADRYVYTFELGGRQVTVAEQQLTPELDRLAQLLLSGDPGLDVVG
jgi:hypothetical protein